MKIYDIYLDNLDRDEYLSLLNCLCSYYFCLFGHKLILKEE